MSDGDWIKANQRVLAAEISRLQALIAGEDMGNAYGELEAARAAMPCPPAMDTLVATLGLSLFERDVLLMCIGNEIQGSTASAGRDNPASVRSWVPTFGLALANFPDAHWSALSPNGPLRRFRLVELDDVRPLAAARLTIDERVLHYLVGINYLDSRLQPIIQQCRMTSALAESHEASAAIAAASLDPGNSRACVQLIGDDLQSHAEVARRISEQFGLQLHEINSSEIPHAANDAAFLAVLWHRESLLLNSALLIRTASAERPEFTRFINALNGLIFLSQVEAVGNLASDAIVTVDKLNAAECKKVWKTSLGKAAESLNGSLDSVVAHFRLGTDEIIRTASGLRAAGLPPRDFERQLWTACRAATRRNPGGLVQVIQPRANWDDLILPDLQIATLHELAEQVRHRFKVYETWGFAAQSARGLGISALFSGESGTGKTMAAEVLANDLELDLYRVDLASLISKYVGETEKNLRSVFDAAEDSGAILLFDEADALFGRRGEVREGSDRYANLEVSYLLQRMEAYRGLAILTTNLKSELDTAFQRRLRFIVQFPFPDAQQRERIWRRSMPPAAPMAAIDFRRLAQLNVAGGDIRNIALNAAFLSAADHSPISMHHLLRSARSEAAKRGRPFSEAEVRGWT
jgi:hypothetical protein